MYHPQVKYTHFRVCNISFQLFLPQQRKERETSFAHNKSSQAKHYSEKDTSRIFQVNNILGRTFLWPVPPEQNSPQILNLKEKKTHGRGATITAIPFSLLKKNKTKHKRQLEIPRQRTIQLHNPNLQEIRTQLNPKITEKRTRSHQSNFHLADPNSNHRTTHATETNLQTALPISHNNLHHR